MNIPFDMEPLYTTIVQEINRLVNEEVIFTNESGIIVASTETKRMGDFHEGSFHAMNKKKKLMMTDQMVNELQGVRRGVVIPVIVNEIPIGVLGITGDPNKVEPYAMLVQKVTELFIYDAITRHYEENKMRDLEFFMFDWLNHTGDFDQLIQRSYFFNLDMAQYSQVVVLKDKQSILNVSYEDLKRLKRMWAQEEALFIRWGREKLLLMIKAYKKESLKIKLEQLLNEVKRLMKAECVAGVGNVVESEKLSDSFKQATRASDIATNRYPVIFEEDLRFDMLQHELSHQTKAQFINRTMQPLISEHVLLHTLHTWFLNNMTVKETTEALHIHKNTLHYRLKKISELTGLNLNATDDLVALYIGSRFLREKEDFK